MYNVSNEFLSTIASPAQEHRLTGTIGSIPFDESNIVGGSFHITNQCTDTSDVVLGSVYIGQLEATFTGIEISYTNWIGRTITPTFSLKVGPNTWEDVPMGIYRIIEASHTADGVHVVAYDNMRKFDKKFKKSRFRFTGGMQFFVEQACTDCHVTFGMTDEEFNALPNANDVFDMFGVWGKYKDFANDIQTYRDLLFWIAQTLGCFATINRAGELIFRKYDKNIVETISQTDRLAGAEFADYITNYTGIYVDDMLTNGESYYGYDATLLQAEISLVQSEIAGIDQDILDNEAALEELERKYEAHEITEEEYQEQKAELTAERKSLNSRRKQLQKRLNWLLKALEKAQSGEEGTFMELGSNPFLQSDVDTEKERERRRVLGALDEISYTPFQCSTVLGVHYDLGDVLYFTGGHAGDDGVFCCLMSYDWNLNGEYQMQGFGVDPSIANVKDHVEKKAESVNENALKAARSTVGTVVPDGTDPVGKDGDFYFSKPEVEPYEPSDVCINHGYFSAPTITLEGSKLNVEAHLGSDIAEWMVFKIEGLTAGKEYTLQSTFQQFPAPDYVDDGCTGVWPWEMSPADVSNLANAICVCDVYPYRIGESNWGPQWTGRNNEAANAIWDVTVRDTYDQSRYGTLHGITLAYDAEEHDYTLPFTAGNSTMYVILLMTRWTTSKLFYANGPSYRDIKWEFTSFWSNGVEFPVMRYYDTEKGGWTDLDYIAKPEESTDTDERTGIGLTVDNKVIKLKPSVMRAWFKADPPQVTRNFNQYCVRYTGKPAEGITISPAGDHDGWEHKAIKVDKEGVYRIRSGGTVDTSKKQWCSYAISGLTVGKRYYFNFACNFKDGTTFGNNFNKGLGVVFSNQSSISSTDYSGEGDTFDANTLYYSMRRSTVMNFADFSFVATATTMYMFVVIGDITNNQTSSLVISKMVISRTERYYVRSFYIFDLVANKWLSYKPFGSGSDEGGEGSSSLDELEDVNIQSLSDGQILQYDEDSGEWVNANPYSLPIASASTLGGIKVGQNLSIDANGVLSATASSDVEELGDLEDVTILNLANKQILKYNSTTEQWENTTDDELIVLTNAQYEALSQQEQNDPHKYYFVTDRNGGGGGGGGASSVSELSDVSISSLVGGQVLKYNSTSQKWENANESGGGGGSSYSVTEIYTGTAITATVTMSDSFENYDALQFTTGFDYNGRTFYVSKTFLKADLETALANSGMIVMGNSTNSYCFGVVSDVDEFTNCYGSGYLFSIKGIKY